MDERDYPNFPPKGTVRSPKAEGGPWAGENITFRELDDEVFFPPELPLERNGAIIGRYVPTKVQQKTRRVTKIVWQPQEEQDPEPKLGAVHQAVRTAYLSF